MGVLLSLSLSRSLHHHHHHQDTIFIAQHMKKNGNSLVSNGFEQLSIDLFFFFLEQDDV